MSAIANKHRQIHTHSKRVNGTKKPPNNIVLYISSIESGEETEYTYRITAQRINKYSIQNVYINSIRTYIQCLVLAKVYRI